MGRYFSGDIEGKFWFAVQNSDAADRFGVTGNQPEHLEYYFCEDNLADINAEIESIETNLGDKLQKIEDFFAEKDAYNPKDLIINNISEDDVSEYADLKLGRMIRDCVEASGSCSFDAEF